MTTEDALEATVRQALARVKTDASAAKSILENVERLRSSINAWDTFLAASISNVELALSSRAAVAAHLLPKFDSIALSRDMRDAPWLSHETAVLALKRLRPLMDVLDAACLDAESAGERGVMMAIGYVMSAIVELDMCLVAAHPDLEDPRQATA